MQIISPSSSPYFQKKQSQPVKFQGIHLEKPSEPSIRVPDDEAGRDVWYTAEHKDIILDAQPFLKLPEGDPKHQEHKQKIMDLVDLTKKLFPIGGKAEQAQTANKRRHPTFSNPTMGTFNEAEEDIAESPKKN